MVTTKQAPKVGGSSQVPDHNLMRPGGPGKGTQVERAPQGVDPADRKREAPVQAVWDKLDPQIRGRLTQLEGYYATEIELVDRLTMEVKGMDVEAALRHIVASVGERLVGEERTRTVPGHVQQRLQRATAAIAHAKAMIVNGAGNQLEAVVRSGGNAAARKDVVSKQKSKWDGVGADKDRPAQARKAELTQGATCGEYAAIVMRFLVSQGEAQAQIVSQGSVHTFVVIGDMKGETADTLVAVDAWPPTTQACVLSDHFCGARPQALTVDPAVDPQAWQQADASVRVKPEHLSEVADTLATPPEKMLLSDASTATYAPGVTRDLRRVSYQAETSTGGAPIAPQLRDGEPVDRSKKAEKARLSSMMPTPAPTPALGLDEQIAAAEALWEKGKEGEARKQLDQLLGEAPDDKTRKKVQAKIDELFD